MKENSGSISLLVKKFWPGDLLAECSALQVDSAAEQITVLSTQITKFEHQISFQAPILVSELKESIDGTCTWPSIVVQNAHRHFPVHYSLTPIMSFFRWTLINC
jgi:hypothetical protein